MPEPVFMVFVYLLAVYGALTLIIGIFESICDRLSSGNLGNVKLILVVKNQQECIEGMIRDMFRRDRLRKMLPGVKFSILDMGSTDETPLILDKLRRDFEYIEIVSESDRQKIFDGFEG